MTPNDIHTELKETRKVFPKSSKMFVGYIEAYDKAGTFEGSTQLGSVIAMKNAWQLENKPPTVTFASTDAGIIEYVRQVAQTAEQSACKMLVVIDMQHSLTSVYGVPKGTCFIATVAYGSPISEKVVVLSQFRDRVLLQSKPGVVPVRLYYYVSPPIASWIEEKALLKAVFRFSLSPIVRAVRGWLRGGC